MDGRKLFQSQLRDFGGLDKNGGYKGVRKCHILTYLKAEGRFPDGLEMGLRKDNAKERVKILSK